MDQYSSYRWRVSGRHPLHWRRWDRAAVVHHPASGETHYLNLFSMVALEQLADREQSIAELAANMAAYLDVEPGEHFGQQVDSLVRKFDELGLIEPCPQSE